MEVGGAGTSAAKRRRGRRLRSWWRHEAQSVRASTPGDAAGGADGVDDTAVKFLLQLALKKEEEEEEERGRRRRWRRRS